ncbi:MAG: response regulator [Opitutaceae bacterium]|nr:response regulator [Opitutaceae bacterium]
MKQLSILLVDDSPEICTLAAHWLREHHTACVHTGSDALAAVSLLHFDVVVTDIVLPDLDGLAIIRKLRQSQPWVRIIAITGGGRHCSAFECSLAARELGADEVLLKPFDEAQLRAAVKSSLALRELQLN